MAYKNILNEIIYEELSISGDVQKASIDIWNQILEKLPNIKTTKIEDFNGVKIGNYNFSTIIYGEKVSVYINLYVFDTKKSFDEHKDKVEYLGANSMYSIQLKWVVFNIPMVSDEVICVDEVKDEIQHELEHIYQGKQGSFGVLNTDYDYKKAQNLVYHHNENVAYIARLIYLSKTYEQDAYVNGLYAYLMAQEEPMPKIKWDIVKESDAYCLLMQLRKAIELLENPTVEIKYICLNFFKKSPYILYKLGKATEFRFVRKIGKVLAKYHKDIREKYSIQEHSFIKIKPFYFI